LVSGRNISGVAAGTSDAFGTLQLIVSMVGTAAGLSTFTGNIQAALGLSGTAAGVATTSADITAKAWAVGEAAGTSTASLVGYATGRLVGTTEETGLIDYSAIASAVLAAAATDPIAANVKEVNNYVVTGTGQSGNEWGPV
jgi:hypothetical protein